MAADLRAALAKHAAANKFSSSFIDGYLTPAFGAKSKSEIDLLVFGCLVDAGAIDPDGPIYDLARALNITPARTRSLILNWQLRTYAREGDLKPAIVAALKKTRYSKDGTLLSFGVENPLLREDIAARLKEKGVFPDASFSKELVKLPVEAFVPSRPMVWPLSDRLQFQAPTARTGCRIRVSGCFFQREDPERRHRMESRRQVSARCC